MNPPPPVMYGAVTLALCAACNRNAQTPAPVPTSPLVAHAHETREPAASSDLLRCPIAVRVYTLECDAGAPSAPFLTGDGVAVIYARIGDGGADPRLFHRVDSHGTLLDPRVLGALELSMSAPTVVVSGHGFSVPSHNAGGWGLTSFDLPGGAARADTPSPRLPGAPEQLAIGPRGVVMTYALSATERALSRGIDGTPLRELRLSGAPFAFVPSEQLLASSERSDVLLSLRRDGALVALDALAMAPDASTPTRVELSRSPNGSESSIAAGVGGFLVAWSEAPFDHLTLARLDPVGARVGASATLRAARDGDVLRYPRVVALGDAWAVSYWDGIGPVVQRLDRDASALGEPLPVRSGDERGGHTDTRMVAMPDGIAVSWLVAEPAMNHGHSSEQPAHPGPRLAVLKCRAPRAP